MAAPQGMCKIWQLWEIDLRAKERLRNLLLSGIKKIFRQANSIELDRTLIAKVKMLFTWSHVKDVDYKGWDLV